MDVPQMTRIALTALAASAFLVTSSVGQSGTAPAPTTAQASAYTPPADMPSASERMRLRSGLAAARGARGDLPHTEQDLPMSAILAGIVLFVIPLYALYHVVVDSVGIAATMAVIMVVAGFVFSSVSGYMAGLVGSSNNPVSGITICTILFASLILLGFLGQGRDPAELRIAGGFCIGFAQCRRFRFLGCAQAGRFGVPLRLGGG